jgi:hypothetical protein
MASAITLDSQVFAIEPLLSHVHLTTGTFILRRSVFVFESTSDVLVPDYCFDMIHYSFIPRLQASSI